MIPDYTNLKMNLEGLNTFFQDNGVKISAEDREKINSIFKECDIAGANNEQKADGELTGQERTNFMQKIQSLCPNIYQKVEDFFVAINVMDDLKQSRQNKEE